MKEITEQFIKGKIAEVLVNQLLSDLGFFILPFGKEHSAAPITNIQKFVKTCNGTFKFDEKLKEGAKKFVDTLPDFIAVNASGKTELIEVKYRKDGRIFQQDDRDKKVFELYPEAVLLVVNSGVEPYSAKKDSDDDKKAIEDAKNTRFTILCREELDKNQTTSSFRVSSRPLANWLIERHGCDTTQVNAVISEYEEYVNTWYPKK